MSSKSSNGFVSLSSVKKGSRPDAADALTEIRRIYFRTTKQTVENDLAHAIELLKSLQSEEDRDKAAVFMEGIAEMRREWAVEARRKKTTGAKATGAKGRR